MAKIGKKSRKGAHPEIEESSAPKEQKAIATQTCVDTMVATRKQTKIDDLTEVARLQAMQDYTKMWKSKTRYEAIGGEDLSTFETSMRWSPMKQAWIKRTIEALEMDEESDSNGSEEEGQIRREEAGWVTKKEKVTPVRCRAPLHEECPKHHGHKGDPGVAPETCTAIGERAQVILVWVRAPDVRNASHPRRVRGMEVRPSAMRSLWRGDFRMNKNTSISGVS